MTSNNDSDKMEQELSALSMGDYQPGSRDEGPVEWLMPQMERTYRRLAPRDETPPMAPSATPESGLAFTSVLQPEADETVLGEVSSTVWRERLLEYKSRQSQAAAMRAAGIQPAPIVPGAANWRPLGPSIVLNGQTVNNQPVAGRVVGLAVAPGGNLVYAASAAGGVFRSDDAGNQWQSLMDGFDEDPEDAASASLACGAIAIDPADTDRIYVGTGEGDTLQLFRSRIVNSLPSYRGIGPIRSDDGGGTWHTEQVATDSPDLAGEAFFALAVDPEDREHVIAATTAGIYQRIADGNGGFVWKRRRTVVHSDVVVARSGSTKRFFAGKWGTGVYHTVDGERWYKTGTGFPTFDVGRIAIGVQPDNSNTIYAFVADINGDPLGLYRLDGVTSEWKEISGVPDVLPGGQGSYDLAISVDPNNIDNVFLGGDHMGAPPWAGSIWRCRVQAAVDGFTINIADSIGTHAHADVHTLVHSPGDSDQLWCGCDGGVFLNSDPNGLGIFESRNNGLSCLHSNFFSQHPTDPNILFVGLQDNGTARTGSPPVWEFVSGGDGGYCLINWNKPNQVLAFANGQILVSADGGNNWAAWDFPWSNMTQPIVSLPRDDDPLNAGDADVVAVAVGLRVLVSKTFANSWSSAINLPGGSGNVFALALASRNRVFMGTTAGQVFRADRIADGWELERIDDTGVDPLGVAGLITEVAVDWSDATLNSIYVVFGGMGDNRHVWRFNGTQWEERSGAGGVNGLLDVEHNALVVDPEAPDNLYVGANIGVWHSPDAGANWFLFQNGLPDAPVYDLKIHPTLRLLRASTHGRGLYEIDL